MDGQMADFPKMSPAMLMILARLRRSVPKQHQLAHNRRPLLSAASRGKLAGWAINSAPNAGGNRQEDV